MIYGTYRCLSTLAFLPGFYLLKLYAFLSGQYQESVDQRLGFYTGKSFARAKKSPRIWMHAASVGEAGVAAAIAEELREMSPGTSLMLSTTTETGQKIARDLLPPSVALMYAPIDAVYPVRKALRFTRPDLLACVETEIWPNLFAEAVRMGTKTVLVNGRISVRSWKKYQKIKSFTRDVLKNVSKFGMIHEDDAGRIRMMGAPAAKVSVMGNAKYDGLIRNYLKMDLGAVLRAYSLSGSERIFVAGSTRRNEESAVLDAYEKITEKFPETLLFIAPRHIERAADISAMVAQRGFDHQLRSMFGRGKAGRSSRIVIIDTIGELAAVYGVSTAAFCGGSLAPLGGQNLLEAAVWGKPVFYGPSMEDFQEAREVIENAVGDRFLVGGARGLAEKVIEYFNNEAGRKDDGLKVRKAVLNNQGAAKKYAGMMLDVISAHP